MDTNWLQTWVGVAFSTAIAVLTVIVTDRRTAGAVAERVRAANASVIRLLLRRLVLEDYELAWPSLTRLLEGKAYESGLRVADLMSERQLLSRLHSEMLENDLMTVDKRLAIERQIDGVMASAPDAPVALAGGESPRAQTYGEYLSLVAGTGVGLALWGSLALSAYASVVPRWPLLLQTAFVLVATWVAYATVRRSRETRVEPSRASELRHDESSLLKEVVRVLEDGKVSYQFGTPGTNMSALSLNLGDRRILVEVKPWPQAVSLKEAQKTANKLNLDSDRVGADEGIIVTPQQIRASEVAGVKIVPIAELAAYLETYRRD